MHLSPTHIRGLRHSDGISELEFPAANNKMIAPVLTDGLIDEMECMVLKESAYASAIY